jgi:hypothetical protein
MKHRTVYLYGWDPKAQWHGPDEIEVAAPPGLVRKLRFRTGWYSGPLACSDAVGSNLHLVARDLDDAVLATLDFPDASGAPAQVLAIIPGHRRGQVRPEFPFNFTSYLALLNALPEGAELAVHDGVEAAMKEQSSTASLVFAITSAAMPCEFAIEMAGATECLIGGILAWVEAKDGAYLAARQFAPTPTSTSSGTSRR